MTWKQLKQYLLARLHRPYNPAPVLWDYPLGRIELSTVSNWIDNSDVITEVYPKVLYSLTDTPIFQNLSEEDYNYFASIPNNM